MKLKKIAGSAAAVSLLAGGLTVASAGTASAAFGCGGVEKAFYGTQYLVLHLYDEGGTWCAVAEHTQQGTYFWTSVQILRSDGAVSPQDEGNFAYYAGPVRIAKNGLCATTYAWSAPGGTKIGQTAC
ncbi:hypothetical protein OG216_26490 [Streptomycetaceae bacterium NBC_01309]